MAKYEGVNSIDMREPCKQRGCGGVRGTILTKGGQDCVHCVECGSWVYNAPKTETGRAVRTTQTVHAAIKPKVRDRVLLRATGRCEICGKGSESCVLHVGHIISVNVGIESGLTEADLNSMENLICECDECNLGHGDEPLPLRFALRLFKARLKFAEMSAMPV